MVQLQRRLDDLRAAGTAVYALSYDPVEDLARFADEHGIAYPLLSDVGSVVIERLGLLDARAADQAAFFDRTVDERHVGLPYPATIVVGPDGVVTDRVVERSYRERPGADALLRRLGAPPTAARSATAEDGTVAVAAWVDDPAFRPMERRELSIRLRVADGWHVYVPPVPEGFTPLRVALVEREGLDARPAEPPGGRPHTVEGLDERFAVVDGEIDLAVPFLLSGARFDALGRDLDAPGEPGPVELELAVAYQACSATACRPPAELRLRLRLDEEPMVPKG